MKKLILQKFDLYDKVSDINKRLIFIILVKKMFINEIFTCGMFLMFNLNLVIAI